MSAAVDQVLARRSRRASHRPEAVSLGVALALHILVVAVALLLPRLAPPPKPLSFVPVQIIPAQALGVRRPASRPRAEKPAPPRPEPVAEEPEPAPEPAAPEPEPSRPTPPAEQRQEAPVLPDKKPEKKPEKPAPPASRGETGRKPAAETSPRKPEPEPPGRAGGTSDRLTGTAAQGTPDGQPGRQGAPTGSALGTSAFGSELAGLDNPDFTYGYYIDQLLSLIDARWVRPAMGDDVRAIISFRINRDGSMGELRVSESSGYNSFDLAALRAVQNAAPFPPLPRAFRHDSLGVNLIVR